MTTTVPVTVSLTIDGVAVSAEGTAEIPDPVAPPSAADVAAALAATPSFVTATQGAAGTNGTNGTNGVSPSAASVEAILAADPNFIKAVAAAVTVSLPPVNPLKATAVALPAGTVGVAYTGSVVSAASGGTPPYSFAASGLPAGVTLNSAGTLSGTPTAAGSFSPTLTVTDSTKATASIGLSISIAPAVIVVPPPVTTQFDFYIALTGNDANPGTLASPWAITSLRTVSPNFKLINGTGKKVGLVQGTYDISGLMVSNSPDVGALQIPGGTASQVTYLASCDVNGNYSARAATIDMKGASGLFGGGHSTGAGKYDGPGIAHCGQYPTAYVTSNLTIDGIRFVGFNYRGLDIGAAYNADGPSGISNVLITNCEFTGGGFNSGDATDNCGALWIQGGAGVTVNNNWFHDSVGHAANSGDHFNAIIVWGPNQGPASTTYNTLIEFNTFVNAGNVYGKEIKVEGTTCQNNYLDMSMFSACSVGFQDFTGWNTAGLTRPSIFRNNIIKMQGNTVGGNAAFGQSTLSNAGTYTTPVQIYNNTIICTTAGSGPVVGWLAATGGGAGALEYYNNIYVSSTNGSWNGFGNFRVNPSAIQIMDFNLVPPSGVSWTLYQNASPTTEIISYSTPAAFGTGLAANGGASGAEANTIQAKPVFVGTGSYAAQYQLAATSPGKGAGSLTGKAGGGSTDMGAWGNGAKQIGCNFAV